MVGRTDALGTARATARGAGEPGWWMDRAARAGLLARALVYATLAVLVAEVALGVGGRTTGQKGAIVELSHLPLGGMLMAALAIGFAAYAIWRAVQAFADTEGKGSSSKGLAVRAGYLGSGFFNAGLAWFAVRTLAGTADSGVDHARPLAARAMALPAGEWLLGAAAVGCIVFGAAQFRRAFARKEQRKHHEERMGAEERRWFDRATKAGFSARGTLYILAGVFLAFSALHRNPGEARGVGDVLAAILAQPFGHILLLLMSVGLAAYAVFAAFSAWYRKVGPV